MACEYNHVVQPALVDAKFAGHGRKDAALSRIGQPKKRTILWVDPFEERQKGELPALVGGNLLDRLSCTVSSKQIQHGSHLLRHFLLGLGPPRLHCFLCGSQVAAV
jgi:hypothetical protein